MEALNQKERSFAEENHGLIYAFLNYYKLPEAEYYDICAIAYLHAVKDWHSKPELREKYRFSTIAFKKMLSAKIKKYHADRVRDAYIAFSLNDLNAEGNEYLAQFPGSARQTPGNPGAAKHRRTSEGNYASTYRAAAEPPCKTSGGERPPGDHQRGPCSRYGILEGQKSHKGSNNRSNKAGILRGGGI